MVQHMMRDKMIMNYYQVVVINFNQGQNYIRIEGLGGIIMYKEMLSWVYQERT